MNTRTETRLDGLEKMIQEMVGDSAENEHHDCFQRLEDLLCSLTIVVEKLFCGEKNGGESSTGNNHTKEMK